MNSEEHLEIAVIAAIAFVALAQAGLRYDEIALAMRPIRSPLKPCRRDAAAC